MTKKYFATTTQINSTTGNAVMTNYNSERLSEVQGSCHADMANASKSSNIGKAFYYITDDNGNKVDSGNLIKETEVAGA